MGNQIIEIQKNLASYLENKVSFKASTLLFILFELIGLIATCLYYLLFEGAMIFCIIYIFWEAVFILLIFKPLLSCFAKNKIKLIYIVYFVKAIIFTVVGIFGGDVGMGFYYYWIGGFTWCGIVLKNLSLGILFAVLHFKCNYWKISSNYR